MKTAILTGASRGIGLAIVKRLILMGYKVYGIARSFENTEYSNNNFIPINCDILNTNELQRIIKQIESEETEINLLVNNAGVGFFGPHEQLKINDIQTMIRTNLEAPLILCKLLLRALKKSNGTIISISSVTAKKISTHGCSYASSKAGLSHFSASLFEEVRKYGVKVTVIHPDITSSNFYDKLDFTYDSESDTVLMEEQTADAVEYILGCSENMVVNDITLRPQKNRIRRKPPAGD
ncbi:SDR family oxidoreductase [Ruminiclostridium cellulolyticum]|uniref:Short-chain dehydrogenase/reductase SDR n=1 Tax=Ruminiclostridium cellulolyticum (strain ATCC 35319 / DSM 5812 / JCM 6584 / H10) TaxID=394503 RepID=B8I795_RUMCH|nr:SDR family oxidoreductase [Ruminiclostridium cellulolyticum]ACL75019.1 short-chain dehydrogenase/reductase SDR [Ruminiclostridium cellulolyticum H10]